MGEKKYIEQDAAIKAVTDNDCEGYATWAIKAVPVSDDVRHVILCKDCRYYKESKVIIGDMVCTYHFRNNYYREPNDFCSKAELKGDK